MILFHKSIRKILVAAVLISIISACSNKNKVFEVSGKIANTNSKKVYLQYLVWGAEKPIVVDSTSLQKNGSFILSTAYGKEESIYELVLPNASVLLINDNEKVFLNIDINSFKNYTVNGSKASAALHEFFTNYSNEYLKLIDLQKQFDTIQNAQTSDSTKTVVRLNKDRQLEKTNAAIITAFKNTNSPALQYYLTAKAFTTMPLKQIQQLNNTAVIQNPNHSGLAFLKSVINKEVEKQKIIELAALKRQKDSIRNLDTIKKLPAVGDTLKQ